MAVNKDDVRKSFKRLANAFTDAMVNDDTKKAHNVLQVANNAGQRLIEEDIPWSEIEELSEPLMSALNRISSAPNN